MTRGRVWSLGLLRARWLPVLKPRYNVGFTFDCPLHPNTRLTVRLENPYDGFKPIGGPGLLVWMVSNGGLARITLKAPSGADELDFGACGRFYIIGGNVEEVL